MIKENQETSLKTPPGHVAQLTTPTKDYSTGAIITPDKSQIETRKVDSLMSPMDLDPQQTSMSNHRKPTSRTNSPTVKPTSGLGKRN